MLLTLLIITIGCAFYGVRLRTWTAAIAAGIVAFAASGEVGLGALVFTALGFAIIAVPLNVLPWRRRLISAPFLQTYLRMIPSLSATEQAALDAGTVGWEGELFAGKPDWKKLQDQPYLELTVEEKAFIDGPVEELCDRLNEWEITHRDADLSPEIWTFLKEHRFFGMIIPKDYGGLGFSAMAHRAVLQKVSSVSSVAGTHIAVPNSLGPAELLLHYGTEDQKSHYLPRLARGEEIPCFALTGPTAGSDATSIPDYGVVCKGEYEGETVTGIRLNFDKRYITLAPVATLIGLAFRLYDPDGLLGGEKDRGISIALVPRETPGLEIGARHFPMNVPFQNGPLRGKDVFVPLETLLGGVDRAGQGWRMLVEQLSVGRAISLPSSQTGGAKTGALATGAYARIRKQFGLPIGRFEGIEAALARIAGNAYSTSALSRMTATAVDLGERPAVPSAIAKYHATEKAREVIQDAMDVHGGKGVILGPRNYLGRAWQGMPIWITVEGANILTRSMMIFGQGAIRCHPWVLKELEAAAIEDSEKRERRFDEVLFGHVGYTIRNAVRSLVLGMSFGKFAAVPSDRQTSRYYQKLSRYSANLAFVSDIAMLTLGGKLKQKEHISARLGDVLSQLYICSAMLKRYEAIGRPAADQAILSWAFHDAVYKIQLALRKVVDNFPNRPMRALLRVVVFPLGRRERAPGDRLTHKVAQLLLAPSETRDRLTHGIYRSARTGNPIGLLEEALPQVIAAEPLERKLIKAIKSGQVDGITWEEQVAAAVAMGVLGNDEAAILAKVRELVLEIIAVDEFETGDLQLGLRRDADLGTQHAA
ncbi:acyl-CoA dehydrogenase [Elongatibacter sediminis]|uniref:Acyl-coenzyme A dehydrogenase n=1 Tax=Elongatibacter sediminis TaxID=3119006 RepID=A0AAW9R933_9GAMM